MGGRVRTMIVKQVTCRECGQTVDADGATKYHGGTWKCEPCRLPTLTSDQERVLLAIGPVMQTFCGGHLDTFIEHTEIGRLDLEKALGFFVDEGIINRDKMDGDRWQYCMTDEADELLSKSRGFKKHVPPVRPGPEIDFGFDAAIDSMIRDRAKIEEYETWKESR